MGHSRIGKGVPARRSAFATKTGVLGSSWYRIQLSPVMELNARDLIHDFRVASLGEHSNYVGYPGAA